MREINNSDYDITIDGGKLWLHINDRKLSLYSGFNDHIRLYREGDYTIVYSYNLDIAYYAIEIYDKDFNRDADLFLNDYKLSEFLGNDHARDLFLKNEYITQVKKLYNIISQW